MFTINYSAAHFKYLELVPVKGSLKLLVSPVSEDTEIINIAMSSYSLDCI